MRVVAARHAERCACVVDGLVAHTTPEVGLEVQLHIARRVVPGKYRSDQWLTCERFESGRRFITFV